MNRKIGIEAAFLLTLLFASICASYVMPTLSAETSPCTDCDAPSLETLHNVTVYLVDNEVLLRIEPLTLPDGCCGDCGECETCLSVDNVESTVLEDEDGRTVVLVTYEVNGTTFETTISSTLLWSYSEDAETTRTASFNSIEVTANGASTQFYSLSYSVTDARYNFTVSTWLDPLDSETYNSSFTVIEYVPAEKSVDTLELVQFDSPVTLSQQYAVLSKVAKGIAKHYEKDENETLQGLAENYNNIKEEAKYLSKLVEKNLQEYDKEILENFAILMDACTVQCFGYQMASCYGTLGQITIGCLLACAAAAINCGPFFSVCLAGCFGPCGLVDSLIMVYCTAAAVVFCCL